MKVDLHFTVSEASGMISSSYSVSHINRFDRKSQIAIEYAYRQAACPQGQVFWVYAANADRFHQAYKNMARKWKLPRVDDPEIDISEIISDWLNNSDNEEWLMVLDKLTILIFSFLQPMWGQPPKQAPQGSR